MNQKDNSRVLSQILSNSEYTHWQNRADVRRFVGRKDWSRMRLKRRTDLMDLYEESMSRIVSHLDTDDVATITSFLTQDAWQRRGNPKALSKAENGRRNKQLARDIEFLGYSFVKVDGQYTQEGHSGPVAETSFFVLKPEHYTLKAFRKDMIGLALKYEQESVIIWEHGKGGTLYATTDFKHYKPSLKFKTFTVDGAREYAWTSFKKNWFTFNESKKHYHSKLMNVSEGYGEDTDNAHPYHFAIRRSQLFGESYR